LSSGVNKVALGCRVVYRFEGQARHFGICNSKVVNDR
jgi:hypothetical protein